MGYHYSRSEAQFHYTVQGFGKNRFAQKTIHIFSIRCSIIFPNGSKVWRSGHRHIKFWAECEVLEWVSAVLPYACDLGSSEKLGISNSTRYCHVYIYILNPQEKPTISFPDYFQSIHAKVLLPPVYQASKECFNYKLNLTGLQAPWIQVQVQLQAQQQRLSSLSSPAFGNQCQWWLTLYLWSSYFIGALVCKRALDNQKEFESSQEDIVSSSSRHDILDKPLALVIFECPSPFPNTDLSCSAASTFLPLSFSLPSIKLINLLAQSSLLSLSLRSPNVAVVVSAWDVFHTTRQSSLVAKWWHLAAFRFGGLYHLASIYCRWACLCSLSLHTVPSWWWQRIPYVKFTCPSTLFSIQRSPFPCCSEHCGQPSQRQRQGQSEG